MSERRYKGASKAERQAERREKLIEAGIQVIGTEGYQATKVKQVCQQAALTERYFYESFANKEVLLCACYATILTDLKRKLIESVNLQNLEPTNASKEALYAFFEHIQSDYAAARLIMIEVLGVSETVDAMYQKAMSEIDEIILLVANPHYEQHEHIWDRNIVSAGLTGAATQIARQWVLNNYEQSIETMVESCFLLFKATIDYFERINEQS